jgi:hypothetical protein
MMRSGNIAFEVEQHDEVLHLSPWISWPEEDKLRMQSLRFILKVPEGRAVYLHNDVAFMLDDVQNVTNTLDRDMVGRRWTMTRNGLDASAAPYDPHEDAAPGEQEEAGTEQVMRFGGHDPVKEFQAQVPHAVPGLMVLLSRVLRLG